MSEPLTQDQAAALLGVTSRRLRQRDIDVDPPTKVNGRYPCREFGEWLRRDWQRGVGITNDGEAYDYSAERARLTYHQANIAALDQQVKAGKLIPVEDVISRWQEMIGASRAKLLALPQRLASTCANLGFNEIEKQSRHIIKETLEELAND